MPDARRSKYSYAVGIICALDEEFTAMTTMLDEEYSVRVDYDQEDTNHYVFGRIDKHNVVVTNLAAGTYGIAEASSTATNMMRSFPNVRNGVVLMVGICGGVWSKENDIRLGDVVVGEPKGLHGGVIAYHRGKIEEDGEFSLTGSSSRPPRSVLTVLNDLKRNAVRRRSTLSKHVSNMFTQNPALVATYSRPGPEEDRLFQWHYKHPRDSATCIDCDASFIEKRRLRDDPSATQVFYGTIGSADIVMKNAHTRDQIANRHKILAFEMEAAGIINVCNALIIRGVCDYADTHKNDQWHNFAAVAAAAYAKELLYSLNDPGGPRENRERARVPKSTPRESRRESVVDYEAGDSFLAHAKAAKAKAQDLKTMLRSKTAPIQGVKDDASNGGDDQLERDHKTPKNKDREFVERFTALSKGLSGVDVVNDRAKPSEPIEGTCEWIMKNETCQSWLNKDMGMLWVVGAADQVGPSTQVVYYRCGGGEQKRNTVISMLRTVLWQIVENVSKSGQTERKECLLRAFDQQERNAKNTGHDYLNNKDSLWKVLLAMAGDPVIGSIYVVLDGLDELDADSVEWLIRSYESLSASAEDSELKVVVVSQEVKEMRELAQKQWCSVINLADNKAHVMSDLEKTASDKLRAIECAPKIEGDIEKRLREALVEKAGDSFVYIECVTKELAQDTTLEQVEKRLDQIPSGLDPYFRYILRQIYERGRLPAVTQILRLIAIAVRPLTVTELAEALRTLSSAGGYAPERPAQASREMLDEAVKNIRDYIDQCSPLLQIRSDSVFFANDSAKTFLFNKQDPPLDEFHIDAVDSNYRSALFCIEYTKGSPLKTRSILSPTDGVFKHWPGLRYSMLHWVDHAKRSGPTAKGLIEFTDFMLDERSDLRDNWWQTFVLHEEESKLYEGLLQREKEATRLLAKTTPPPLHMCARLGLTEWVRHILDKLDSKQAKIAVNTGDVHAVPPLMWAAIEGHVETSKLLIAAGANINELSTLQPKTPGSSHGLIRRFNSYTRQVTTGESIWTGDLTVLYRAAFRAHVDVVELLLDHGADVNALGWTGLSACHAAAMCGNDQIMRLILERSAKNINKALAVGYNTPLHYAVESDFLEVTKTLLLHGADVRMAEMPTGYNALHLAIRGDGSPTLIAELLKSVKGYERQKLLDTRIWGDSAIHMAALHASVSTIQTLLSFKADIEARTLTYRDTAIIMAARSGRPAAVAFFLESGADANASNATGSTALIEAAYNGFPRTVEALLEHGADVSAKRRVDYNTALHLAARNASRVSCDCYVKVIKLLLSKGADVNAKNSKYQTPLDKAVNRQDKGTIDLLRAHGAVLYKPNKDVLEQYSDLFDPDPEATSVMSSEDLERTESRDTSLTTTRTNTETEDPRDEDVATRTDTQTEEAEGEDAATRTNTQTEETGGEHVAMLERFTLDGGEKKPQEERNEK